MHRLGKASASDASGGIKRAALQQQNRRPIMPDSGSIMSYAEVSAMSPPRWYRRLSPHPDYDRRIILLDSNLYFDACRRTEYWTPELSWVISSRPSELIVKMNAAIKQEVLGANTQNLSKSDRDQQVTFVSCYRRLGKIVLDEWPVPYLRQERLPVFLAVDAVLKSTANLSEMDRPTVTDAIVNRIPILTRDEAMIDGVSKALRNRAVDAALRANGLSRDLGEILLVE